MSEVVPFARTLEQEVLALFRGASMECLVCGEFVMRSGGGLACPECAATIRTEGGRSAQLGLDMQAG